MAELLVARRLEQDADFEVIEDGDSKSSGAATADSGPQIDMRLESFDGRSFYNQLGMTILSSGGSRDQLPDRG